MSSALPAHAVHPASRLGCYQLDPIQDSRWARFLERHPDASVFHSIAWLKALRLTYGYQPIVFTTSSPTSELANGVVFCDVNSWLTGRRLVSLPFSDHCEFLGDSSEALNFLIRHLQTISRRQHWKYLELRPIHRNFGGAAEEIGLRPSATYLLHTIDLRPTLDELFRSFDRDCVQRRIQRAERAGLIEKCGRSDDLLKDFYTLLVLTRRHHGVPPAPYTWFRNLVQFQGLALEIRVAYKDRTPIAAILTLRFRDVVYYKYGCSDERFKKFGATPWLLWKAMIDGKSNGGNEFDMGRSGSENSGLIEFKSHWSPHAKQLVYWRFPETSSLDRLDSSKMKTAKRIFSHMPRGVLVVTGRLAYRHIG